MVKFFTLSLLLVCSIIGKAQTIKLFCNDNICSFFCESNYNNEDYLNYQTGYPPATISIYRIINQDTSLLFLSIGCSQYSINNNFITIYTWLDSYYETDCNCTTETNTPCKPDISECDVFFQYQYSNNIPILTISPIKNHNSDNNSNWNNILTHINSDNYIRITNSNRLFRKNKYLDSYRFTANLLLDDEFLSQYNYFVFDCLNNQKQSTLSKLNHNLEKLSRKDTNYNVQYTGLSVYSNYYDSVAKYLAPIQNQQFIGKRIFVFQNKMRRLITTTKNGE